MKKGFIYNTYPDLNAALYQLAYAVAMSGMQRSPFFERVFYDFKPDQRGIVFQPYLVSGKDAYDIASAHYELLTEHNPDWNNGVPIIVDCWNVPAGADAFQFDQIKIYLSYLHERLQFQAKPLLRVTAGQWNKWMDEIPTEAVRILSQCDLLLAYPNAQEPASLNGVGKPAWWEYQWSMIAYDESKLFSGINVQPEEEPIEEPAEEPDEEPDEEPAEEPSQVWVTLFEFFGGQWRIQKRVK